MTKKVSIVLSIMIIFLTFFVLPQTTFAETKEKKMTVSGPKTVYTACQDTLTVKVNKKTVSAKKCTFSSSDKSVAKVNKSGVITGVKSGKATITVKLKSNKKVYKKVKIKVKNNPITTPNSTLTFAKGCSNSLNIYVSGEKVGSSTVSFSSSNKKVATVDVKGKVKAVKKGTAYITVKLKKNKAVFKKIKIDVIDTTYFTITPTTLPLNGSYLNFSSYNEYTKTYYAVRSYLEYCEKHSGCTIRFSAGEYKIPNILYISSNTTIILSDGVVISKTSKTDSTKLYPSGSLFMFCNPSKGRVKGAYSEYNGVHNVKLIGEGNATVSMIGSNKNVISLSIVMAHNKNIEIKGIRFTDLPYGHFIEMDASKNVVVEDCSFENLQAPTTSSSSECINLDTPDKITNGFHQVWTSYDCTPNKNVTINNCSFVNVQRGIGTHQYSVEKYHRNITITNCVFKKCFYGGVYMMNWKNAVLNNNVFDGIGKDYDGTVLNTEKITSDRAFYVAGCSKITITNNSFQNCYQIGAVKSHQSNGFPTIYSKITEEEFELMQTTNTVGDNVDRDFVRAYKDWDGKNTKYHDYYVGITSEDDSIEDANDKVDTESNPENFETIVEDKETNILEE